MDLHLAYAGVIISFLGGVQWGSHMSIVKERLSWYQTSAFRFVMSIIPTLQIWPAVYILPWTMAYSVSILSMIFVLLMDVKLFGNKHYQQMPSWYINLRYTLTVGAFTGLGLGWYQSIILDTPEFQTQESFKKQKFKEFQQQIQEFFLEKV